MNVFVLGMCALIASTWSLPRCYLLFKMRILYRVLLGTLLKIWYGFCSFCNHYKFNISLPPSLLCWRILKLHLWCTLILPFRSTEGKFVIWKLQYLFAMFLQLNTSEVTDLWEEMTASLPHTPCSFSTLLLFIFLCCSYIVKFSYWK